MSTSAIQLDSLADKGKAIEMCSSGPINAYPRHFTPNRADSCLDFKNDTPPAVLTLTRSQAKALLDGRPASLIPRPLVWIGVDLARSSISENETLASPKGCLLAARQVN
jgi:hypothetical protein